MILNHFFKGQDTRRLDMHSTLKTVGRSQVLYPALVGPLQDGKH